MKHPFYLGWVVLTLGTLSVSNLGGWRILPVFGGARSGVRTSSSSGSGAFFSGWRSFGSGGGSFHK
ncbi:MAG: hypothetical protein JWO82_1653 [Akkermansiaceae bacterium]|nr:hypothetical protein [Akkermansiaceae bacterium]